MSVDEMLCGPDNFRMPSYKLEMYIMPTEVPRGYWLVDEAPDWIRVGMQYGGHEGGEVEIQIPRSKTAVFFEDEHWGRAAIRNFSKLVLRGSSEHPMYIPASEQLKTGEIPTDWERLCCTNRGVKGFML